MKKGLKYSLFALLFLFVGFSSVNAASFFTPSYWQNLTSCSAYSGSTSGTCTSYNTTVWGQSWRYYSVENTLTGGVQTLVVSSLQNVVNYSSDISNIRFNLIVRSQELVTVTAGSYVCTVTTISTSQDSNYSGYVVDCPNWGSTTGALRLAFSSDTTGFQVYFGNIYVTYTGDNDVVDAIYDQTQAIEDVNSALDEIKDMDISDDDKELPDDSAFNDYTEVEDDLMDYVNEADTSILDVAIDVDSSSFVWDTLTSLIQSHTLIFSTIIAILSIGIIKLALGR